MRRFLHQRCLAAGLLAAGGSCLVGCADNESVMFIKGVMLMEPPECTVTAEAGAVLLLNGTVDAALTEVYQSVLLVGNQLVRKGSPNQMRTETSRVSMEGAEVHVLTVGGIELDSFTVPASGDIGPGSGQEPGYGTIMVNLLEHVPKFAGEGTVIVDVQVFGETLGGQAVESNWFTFPIQVGTRWLIEYPPEALSSDGHCVSAADEETRPCFTGQDGLTTCTLCAGSTEACFFAL